MNLSNTIRTHNYTKYGMDDNNYAINNEGNNFLSNKQHMIDLVNNKIDQNNIIEGFETQPELWNHGVKGITTIDEDLKKQISLIKKIKSSYKTTLQKYKIKYSSYLMDLSKDKQYRNYSLEQEIKDLNNDLIKYAGELDILLKDLKRKIILTRNQSKVEEVYKLNQLEEYNKAYKELNKELNSDKNTLTAMEQDTIIKNNMYSYHYYIWVALTLGLGMYVINKLRTN
jgi:hypothetical protein